MTSIKLMAVAILVATALQPCTAAGQYFNISNAPFATVSNGPQNAVVVDVANPNDPTAVDAAVSAVIGRTTRAATQSAFARQIAELRNRGLLKPNVEPKLYGMVMVRSAGSIEPVTRATRAYGGGTITFTYSGWNAADPVNNETVLRRFAGIAYPIVRQIYGDPARTITVNVFNDVGQIDKDALLGGLYVTGSGVQPQIRLTAYNSVISLERAFLHMMIRAFHDTAAFNYDAWEEGFDRSASVVAGQAIDRVINSTHPAGLEPLDFVGVGVFGNDPFYYRMAEYEVLNQPPLSNNTFFTSWANTLAAPVDFGGLIIPRCGMASTAWLKVYTERLRTDGQSFFKLFNTAYYSALTSNTALPGNVPALKAIAATVTPNVEGQSFDDWFRQQYIFDTSVSIGTKLFALAYPPSIPADPGTEGYSLPVSIIYYQTTSTGDETPLGATVYPVYWNYLYKTDIPLHAQYETVTITGGQGDVEPTFFVDTIGGPQRVAIDFTAGSETARVYFPAGKAGTAASPNNFIGVVVGSDAGSVNVKVDAETVGKTASIGNGAFGASLTTLLDFSRLRITLTLPDTTTVSKTVNAGPGSYQTIIHAPAAATTLTHTFLAGMRMVSVPMTTFAQDQAQAMADQNGTPIIPANQLLLARWNPALTATYKYEMYPRTPPFAPGRAYWVKFPGSKIVNIEGQLPDSTANWRIGLVNGWNQIGGPFNAPVPVTSLLVEKANEEPIGFSDAWSQGLIGKVIWKYTPGTGYSEATSLDPWEGYWVKCNVAEGVVLIVPGPDSRSRSRSVAADIGGSSKDNWSMKLSAVGTSGGDGGAVTLGVAAGASDAFDNPFDADGPPTYGAAISVSSIIPGRAGDPTAVDTRAAGSGKLAWDLAVTPAQPNQDVILRWQDLSSVPKRYRLTLLDKSTGRSQYMRTTSSYKFNSGDGNSRQFSVTADSSPSARLMITNLMVSPSRGSTVSFSYNLSADAAVAAEIIGPNGKPIRRLALGKPSRSGINSMAWDRRDDSGVSIPTGTYILQMTAATEDGEVVKTIRPIMVAR